MRRYGLRLCVAAVADSSGAVAAAPELPDAYIARLVGHKAAGRALADLPGDASDTSATLSAEKLARLTDELSADATDGRLVLVDASATDTTALLIEARRLGWSLALANKLPLTGPMRDFEAITLAGRGARWETTVASALPVMSSLQSLVERGDHVRWVTGAFSGTMGYVVHRLEQGGDLSEAVAEAVSRGYVEPDPRADLSGLDAGRKALIVARTIGYELELADVAIEGLYPPEWDRLELGEFRARLPEIDDLMARRVAASRDAGSRVRYLAYVGEGTARTEVADVAAGSRLAGRHATDSLAVIETDHFRTNPLVLSGRGGGPKVTAAGVLGDVLSLVRD
ncbi:MAG: hypothetical protein ACK2UL_09950 [Anaerolineae bacterium]